jgi:UDP-N-acetylmuramate dehydrogenase
MQIKAFAKNVCIPHNLQGIIEAINNEGINRTIVLIGNGSNIIFSKPYYDDTYLFILTTLLNNIEYKEDLIHAEAGVTTSKLSWYALEKSIRGVEFLEDIPGTVGGGLVMNAGTYEQTIGALCHSVTWYDINRKSIITSTNDGNLFSRRQSVFDDKNKVILSCELKANRGDYNQILELIIEIKKKRYLKQPRNYPNAGSVFKRPQKDGQDYYVWKLLDEAGLRGYSIGDAMISDKHPGFIVNKGNCTGKDVLELLEICQKKVKNQYCIDLQVEWKIVK